MRLPGLHRSSLAATVAGLLLPIAPAQAALDGPSAAALAALQANPALAGELIYRGDTHVRQGPMAAPLFRYERRLSSTASGLQATHLTHDPAQGLVIAESAVFDADYRLQRVAVQNRQQGFSGEVTVSADGRRLSYRLNDNGVVSTAEERVDRPLVSGATLFGYVVAHAAELAQGRTLSVGFVVPKAKQSYGFDIHQVSAAGGPRVYAITPSSAWLRLVVAPMRLVLDADGKTVLRYEGRVPPMQTAEGRLVELDARVEYHAVASTYR